MQVNSNLFLKPQPESNAFGAAEILARARQSRLPLATFPGLLPTTRAGAYAIQDRQIMLRQSSVIGWKVALTNPLFLEAFGAPRLVGPAFADRLIDATVNTDREIPVSMIPNGFCAVEAEFIAVINQDVDPAAPAATPESVSKLVRSLHIGVEIAGSPVTVINDLGSFAASSDCGNNDGLILGPEIKGWSSVPLESLTATTSIDGAVVGVGHAAKVPGGPMAALAFLINCLAERGIRLRAGDLVSTGATTGVHEIRAGQSSELNFGKYGVLRLKLNNGSGA
jgi:2-keto-4-pentenoate hydratase